MSGLKTILDENSYVNELNNKLENGGVIAFVTDTVWGLGCLPYNKQAVDKIYEIKGRDRSKPLILMSNSVNSLLPYVEPLPPLGVRLAEMYFPGALTIVSKKSEKTPDYITSNKNTVGIRVPNNKFFSELCSKIKGGVLATTSANLSNHPSSKTYEQACNSIGALVDTVFKDYGYQCLGLESTIVLLNGNNCVILRQGAVDVDI